MKITINLHMIINGTRTMKCGDFYVKASEDIPKFAYNWIYQTRKETGYFGHQSIIEKVIVDGNKDITEAVKNIDEAPIEKMDDIFW